MNRILIGDCRASMLELIGQGVKAHTCVTSPPYWGLRDYGHPGQLGLEATSEEYVNNMVEVFRLVREVLHDDGTLWLNLGDSYISAPNVGHGNGTSTLSAAGQYQEHAPRPHQSFRRDRAPVGTKQHRRDTGNLKPKDMVGIPWRVALALQADGWWLRSDIIWNKPNGMPASHRDRPTVCHEYLFLLAKSEIYFYDHEAIKEPVADSTLKDRVDTGRFRPDRGFPGQPSAGGGRLGGSGLRNKRTVWTVTTKPYDDAHFAVFPEDLVEPCILAGTSARGHCPKCGAGWTRIMGEPEPTGGAGSGNKERKQRQDFGGLPGDHRHQAFAVPWEPTTPVTIGWEPGCKCGLEPEPGVAFDPFMGSGTTAKVAGDLGRKYLGCELNGDYTRLQDDRTRQSGLVLA